MAVAMRFAVYSLQKATGFRNLSTTGGASDRLMTFDGSRKGATWLPPSVRLTQGGRPWDIFTVFGPSALALTARATSLLRPYFHEGPYELLPLPCNEDELTVVNVLEICSCLDRKRTKFRSTGSIERYAFLPEKFRWSLFKIPEAKAGTLLVATDAVRPERSFKHWVERHDLKGIEFKLLWHDHSIDGAARKGLRVPEIRRSKPRQELQVLERRALAHSAIS
jgi:hypothetical protein